MTVYSSTQAPIPVSSADLVKQAQQGNSDAFGQLYEMYADAIYRFIYYRVGNKHIAEDLTSDAFVRALKNLPRFVDTGTDVGAWIMTIARNILVDHYKSAHQRLSSPVPDMPEAVAIRGQGSHDAEYHPEQAVAQHLINVELLNGLKTLPLEQQECLTLRFLMGHTINEVAQIMGKNPGAVKALQFRATAALYRAVPHLRWTRKI